MANNTVSRTARPLTQPAKEIGEIKSYPAPKQLATPTDLKPEEVGRIVEAVNPLIADAFALFTRTKNFQMMSAAVNHLAAAPLQSEKPAAAHTYPANDAPLSGPEAPPIRALTAEISSAGSTGLVRCN